MGNANLSPVITGKDQTVGLYHMLNFWAAEVGGEGSHKGAAPCEGDGSVLPTPTEDVTPCGNNPAGETQPAPESCNWRENKCLGRLSVKDRKSRNYNVQFSTKSGGVDQQSPLTSNPNTKGDSFWGHHRRQELSRPVLTRLPWSNSPFLSVSGR